jgi:hypothetical protein
LFSFDFWFENFYKTSDLNLGQTLKFAKLSLRYYTYREGLIQKNKETKLEKVCNAK